MKVSFYASLRPLVGEKTVQIQAPEGCTIEQLLAVLVERYPALRPMLLHADGSLQAAAHVFVNGRDAHLLPGGLLTGLQPGDSLDIFPPVGGGQLGACVGNSYS